MEYMFVLFIDDDKKDSSTEKMSSWRRFEAEAAEIATEIASGALQGTDTATVVAMRGGETFVTDGPFIDSKEGLAGYYVYDCDNLDNVLKVAAMIPVARVGHVEVRPMVDFSAETE